ncbi:hypothetical protein [Chlamydia felis]|uniref:hypothetical protein n=1 Tax=Chlamydia felis TaxID=83556 RepID=UPI00031EDC2A|nr:hypothetical protein [Chlamydia felis]
MKKIMLALLLLTSCSAQRVFGCETSFDKVYCLEDSEEKEGGSTEGSCTGGECWED